METRYCSQHYQYFPLETEYRSVLDFGKQKSSIDGLLDHCKRCKQAINARPKGNSARRSGVNPATGIHLNYIGRMNEDRTLFRYKRDICAALNIPYKFAAIPEGLQETEPTFVNESE